MSDTGEHGGTVSNLIRDTVRCKHFPDDVCENCYQKARAHDAEDARRERDRSAVTKAADMMRVELDRKEAALRQVREALVSRGAGGGVMGGICPECGIKGHGAGNCPTILLQQILKTLEKIEHRLERIQQYGIAR